MAIVDNDYAAYVQTSAGEVPLKDLNAQEALEDIKVGWDGTTYDTPGDAVRGQIGELNDDLSKFVGTNRNFGSGNFNNITDCGIYAFAGGASSNVQNAPIYPVTGSLLVLNNSAGNVIGQLFINNNKSFFRLNNGDWNDWKEIQTEKYFTIDNSNLSSGNLNDYLKNSIYSFAGNITETQVQNAPFYPFNGIVLTFFASDNVGGQFVISGSSKLYYRSYYASWKNWSVVLTSSDIEQIRNEFSPKLVKYPYSQNKLINCFLNVGVIGDSLASGECGDGDSTPPENLKDVYSISWGKCLQRMTGNNYYNFSKGGLTTKTWLTSIYKDQALSDDKKCDCYFIGLGVNDAYDTSLPLGSINDINVNDYTQNADSFYGNYGKIISLMKSHVPLAKFFVFTMPRELNGTRYDNYNTAVRNIANLFDNVYLIDLVANHRDEYLNGLISQGYRQGHYNAVSYQLQANIIYEEVCKIMETNIQDFLKVELINEYGKYPLNT